jgi:hypothetical protein
MYHEIAVSCALTNHAQEGRPPTTTALSPPRPFELARKLPNPHPETTSLREGFAQTTTPTASLYPLAAPHSANPALIPFLIMICPNNVLTHNAINLWWRCTVHEKTQPRKPFPCVMKLMEPSNAGEAAPSPPG